MKKLSLFIFILLVSSASAQRHLDFQAGYSYINPTEWNKTISAYNYARPWLEEKQPELHSSFRIGVGYSGVIGKGLFLSPSLSHQIFSSYAENGNSKADLRFRWMSAELALDIYPMEFGLDSVSFKIRPFVRIGGGASAILPRVFLNDSLSTARDEEYNPIVWTYQFSGGIGCRFAISNTIDLTPMITTSYFPSIDIENFRYALHGTEQPGLTDIDKFMNWRFTLSLSIRLGSKDNLTD
ncbi:MAG: hypothetical protein WED33_12410 [Bacteroidia bacterium]